ncbi:MAG: beta-hydroxyacyl-ACP dehydratase [Planctomycetes bacterium]|nr:beta-hydroxyacyl-ACP dehydratase [Planctomycetota bacterium]
MPPKLLYDVQTLDLTKPEIGIEDIRRRNPQRYEMEQLTAILKFDPQNQIIVGYKDVTDQEFWIRGHIPGRPLMPGVMMVEAAAQLCTYYFKRVFPESGFVGFGGIDAVKFRGTVVPGDKLILIARNIELRARRTTFETQGVVNGRLVYEGIIVGMPV